MFSYPTRNKNISSDYGMRNHPITKVLQMHQGKDFTPVISGQHDDVLAMADGVVKLSRWQYNRKGFGQYIIIEHKIDNKPVCTIYAHLHALKVKRGQTVSKGQAIAAMGSTGASTGVHCHFGVFECSFANFFKKGPKGYKYAIDPDKYLERKEEKPSNEVPEWAETAWVWAVSEGILSDSGPNETVTRAMLAQALYNKITRGV